MNRILMLAVLLGLALAVAPSATAQGIGINIVQPGFNYFYPPVYPIAVRPSGYAAGYTYTYPGVVYPNSYRYRSGYRYRGRYPYGGIYQGPIMRGPVIRSYPATPGRSGSPFGPAHSSQYFGNPHASQYFGR